MWSGRDRRAGATLPRRWRPRPMTACRRCPAKGTPRARPRKGPRPASASRRQSMPSSADHCSAIAAKRSSLPPATRGPFAFSHAWGPSTRQALMLTAAASPQAKILTFFQPYAYAHVYAKEVVIALKKSHSTPPRSAKLLTNNDHQSHLHHPHTEFSGHPMLILLLCLRPLTSP